MKKAIITLLVVIGIVWAGLATVGVEPKDRRPGTRLDGTVTALPADLSYTDEVMEVHLETYPWWGVPFSVTTVLARDGNDLFVPSLYEAEMPFPGSKFWNKVVQRNPDVRLRVGEELYELQIAPITDEAQFQRALQAFARKYPFWADKMAADEPPRSFALLALSRRS